MQTYHYPDCEAIKTDGVRKCNCGYTEPNPRDPHEAFTLARLENIREEINLLKKA